MKKRNFGVSGAVLATAFVAGLAGIVSPAHAQTKVVVDPGKKYQVFEGWGTSLCWWAVKAGAWSEANRSKLLGAIADPDTGLGYTIFRYNIGPDFRGVQQFAPVVDDEERLRLGL